MPYKNKEDKLARARAYHHENKEAKNAYHREYAKNNREKINESIRALKDKKKETLLEHLGGKCVGCGTTENLQFDHIDRTKKSFTIGKCLGYTLEKLIKEADKCQLLCKECHQYKTTINHDMSMMAEGYKVKEIKQVGNEVVVTLYKPS